MLAAKIEHTLLKPQAQRHHIENLCKQAKSFNFHGVCVNPFWVQPAKEFLQGSSVKVVSVIGFPLGATLSTLKSKEAHRLIQLGADEVDMVLNVGALKDKEYDLVLNDIRAVIQAAEGRPVKVILETALLSQDEKVAAIEVCRDAEVHFVKTCTGFAGGGATVEDIQLIRSIVGDKAGIKASGGIKTREQAEALVEAGADRLGTSSGVALVTGEAAGDGY